MRDTSPAPSNASKVSYRDALLNRSPSPQPDAPQRDDSIPPPSLTDLPVPPIADTQSTIKDDQEEVATTPTGRKRPQRSTVSRTTSLAAAGPSPATQSPKKAGKQKAAATSQVLPTRSITPVHNANLNHLALSAVPKEGKEGQECCAQSQE